MKRMTIAVPPKPMGLLEQPSTDFSPIEVIELEGYDGVWRCVDCRTDWGFTEPFELQFVLDIHLENHRAYQKELADDKKIAAILQEAYDKIALIKGEQK